MNRKVRWCMPLCASLLGMLATIGCDKGSSTDTAGGAKSPPAVAAATPTGNSPGEASTPPKAPSPPPDIKPTAGTATVTGRVSFNGEPPKRKPINFGPELKCHEQHTTPPQDDTVVVGADRSIQWVFVRVASKVPGTFPAPAQPAVLDQKGCIFTPHVLGVQTGQELELKNSDPVLHNIRCEAVVNPPFNRNLPKPGDVMKVKFDVPEVGMKLKCDVHFWMGAHIHVIPHPFFAVTGADGRFTISKLPPGTHKLEVWHEKFGRQTKEVTVKDGEVLTADFAYEAK